MEAAANVIQCPQCHSIPDSYTELPVNNDSPFADVQVECDCGHTWQIMRFGMENNESS